MFSEQTGIQYPAQTCRCPFRFGWTIFGDRLQELVCTEKIKFHLHGNLHSIIFYQFLNPLHFHLLVLLNHLCFSNSSFALQCWRWGLMVCPEKALGCAPSGQASISWFYLVKSPFLDKIYSEKALILFGENHQIVWLGREVGRSNLLK